MLILVQSIALMLLLIIPVLVGVAFFTLYERKVMATLQRRKGPNVVGFFGLLQPFADALKLIIKETIIPIKANEWLFILAPILTFFLSLILWVVLPFDFGKVLLDLNLGILYVFAVSSLSVYGIIIAGWSSNSKYAFLGALRSAAQMISYEISIGLIIISIIICSGSANLSEIVLAQEYVWFIFPCFPLFLMFIVSVIAETNRAPFDLPEAEAELVSGYNVEYSAIGFALFFMGEYANIMFMSSLTTILFLGGWLPPLNIELFYSIPGLFWFSFKTVFIMFLFIWVRASFPRYRYDQLMFLGWKVFLPLTLGWVIFISGVFILFDFLI